MRAELPSESRLLVWQACACPFHTPKTTPASPTKTLLPVGLQWFQQRQLLRLYMNCAQRTCEHILEGGWVGGTQWSEHIGHCGESLQEQLVSWRVGRESRDEEGDREEAVRYTDNGIRLKHSERFLSPVKLQTLFTLSTQQWSPLD